MQTQSNIQIVSHVELSDEEASMLRKAFPESTSLKEAVIEAARLAIHCSQAWPVGDESPAGSH